MTTIRQLIQTSPAKANELFAKLADTSESAVKTRERLFSELKGELELLSSLEEQHLFPVLRKHKETKDLVAEAISDNKQTRKLLTELERTPKESEEFASKVVELRKAFQQHVRDEKNELLPAVLKALSDEEAQAVVETIEAEKAGIETAKRAEAEQRRAEARREREEAEELAEEQKQAARREKEARKAARQTAEAVAQTSEAVAESSREVVQSAAESAGRLATAPLSSGSQFWDAMFGMWSVPQSRSGNARSSGRGAVFPRGGGDPARGRDPDRGQAAREQRHDHGPPLRRGKPGRAEGGALRREGRRGTAQAGHRRGHGRDPDGGHGRDVRDLRGAVRRQGREGEGRGRRAPGAQQTGGDGEGHRAAGRDRGRGRAFRPRRQEAACARRAAASKGIEAGRRQDRGRTVSDRDPRQGSEGAPQFAP